MEKEEMNQEEMSSLAHTSAEYTGENIQVLAL